MPSWHVAVDRLVVAAAAQGAPERVGTMRHRGLLVRVFAQRRTNARHARGHSCRAPTAIPSAWHGSFALGANTHQEARDGIRCL
jgi:hypothetical protein